MLDVNNLQIITRYFLTRIWNFCTSLFNFAPHIKIQNYGILFVLVILILINYDLEFCSTNSNKLICD
jgi:hypothetical protein